MATRTMCDRCGEDTGDSPEIIGVGRGEVHRYSQVFDVCPVCYDDILRPFKVVSEQETQHA